MPTADPQLDANVLIHLHGSVTEFVAYARANQAAGLTYSETARTEFLAGTGGDVSGLDALERQYGVSLIRDVAEADVEVASDRLRRAFDGDLLGRRLHEGDSRVAATAWLKNERLATGDLPFFKRLRDLGIEADYIGTGRPATQAAAYVPRAVVVPEP